MTSPLASEKIGKYTISREIGRGATSRVLLAHDPFAARDVAIKLVQADPGMDAEMRRRFEKVFLNEASLAGQLVHPHIIAIYDADVAEDYRYIVMEYVNGSTLEPYCRPDNLLPVADVVETAFKCALALDFSHRKGIIHRDIKPANIMIGPDRETKVTDFGVSYRIGADKTQLRGVGSPAYMSPEQIQETDVTHQSDIYSLGIVMYQLLTGKLPFTAGSTESLMYQVVHLDHRPPVLLRADLSPALNDIVMRATARNRDERYATWAQFAEDLSSVHGKLALPSGSLFDTEKFRALKAIPFFRAFPERELWEIVRSAIFRRFTPDEVVVSEGLTCDSFYLIASGEARVTLNTVPLSVLADGDCFGEIPYFEDRGVRHSSVSAITPMTVVEIKAQAMESATDACQKQFNRAFVGILFDRIERMAKANVRLAEQLSKVASAAL